MAELQAGDFFGSFRVEEEAGRGGMGVVYRAHDVQLNRRVALKIIDPARLDDPGARQRFLRETRAAAAIEHPNVVPIYAAGEDGGIAYMVMRFVDGEDLRRRVRRSGPLEPEQAVSVISQLGAALDAAHAAGLVHRDVKPANALLGDHGHVYLTDFGIAGGAAMTAVTAAGQWVGSSDFVAPEQIRGDPVDARTDVYALGALLHYALTGDPPFIRDGEEARLWAHLHAVAPAPSRGGAPRAFDAVVARAMAKDPGERYATAGELSAAARDALRGRTAAIADVARRRGRRRSSAGSARRERRSWTLRPAPAAALSVTLLAVGTAVGLLLPGSAPPDPVPPTPIPTPAPTPTPAPRPPTPQVADVRVGKRPVALLRSGSWFWIASTEGSKLHRVYEATMKPAKRPPRIGEGASDLLEYRNTLWVAAMGREAVLRLHPRTGRPVAPALPVGGEPRVLASGHGSIWVAERRRTEDRLMRFDARTGALLATRILREGISDMEHTSGTLWVLGRLAPKLMKFDAKTLERGRAVAVGADPRRMKMTPRHVWVANHGDDSIARVDRRTRAVTTISTCNKPYGIDEHAGIVWIACFGDGAVARVNARTRRSIPGLIQVGVNPVGLLATRDAVWVTGADDGTLTRITNRNAADATPAPGVAG